LTKLVNNTAWHFFSLTAKLSDNALVKGRKYGILS